jgi:hypothetical protein
MKDSDKPQDDPCDNVLGPDLLKWLQKSEKSS